jgi:cell division protein FtsB
MAVIAAVIIPIIMYFENKPETKTPEEIAQEAEDAELEAKKWTALSSWLAALMSIFQYLYIIGAPGIFVSSSMTAMLTD